MVEVPKKKPGGRWAVRCLPYAPEIDELKAEVKRANEALAVYFGRAAKLRVAVMGRLGPKSPHAHFYPGCRQAIKREHSAYVDAYVNFNASPGFWSSPSSRALRRAFSSLDAWPGYKLELPVRPAIFDPQGLPHCEDGPWIEWPNGDAWYAYHGVEIPDWWITNRERLTPEYVLGHVENSELRRAATDILGWDKILEDLHARVIDSDGDPEIGELIEVELPRIGLERFMRVRCATGRWFAIPVPPTTRTALEGQAWLWGLDSDVYVRPSATT